jgi:hypothetical protein
MSTKKYQITLTPKQVDQFSAMRALADGANTTGYSMAIDANQVTEHPWLESVDSPRPNFTDGQVGLLRTALLYALKHIDPCQLLPLERPSLPQDIIGFLKKTLEETKTPFNPKVEPWPHAPGKIIYKYTLHDTNKWIELPIPDTSTILAFQKQGSNLCIWAIPGEKAAFGNLKVIAVGTGVNFSAVKMDGSEYYVATAQDTNYVWHLFGAIVRRPE